MKSFMTLLLCSVLVSNLFAQEDTTQVKVLKKNVVTVVEDGNGTKVKVGENKGVEVITDDWGDTTRIRIGRRTFDVVENGHRTYVNVSKEPRSKNWNGHFNPHWAGIEVGMNLFSSTDYSMYNGDEFFDLIPGKSLTWNINFAEWAFRNQHNNFALVTGLGFSFSDVPLRSPDHHRKRPKQRNDHPGIAGRSRQLQQIETNDDIFNSSVNVRRKNTASDGRFAPLPGRWCNRRPAHWLAHQV